MKRKTKKLLKSVNLLKEFKEFYVGAFKRNKRMTLFATLFVSVAVYDEIREFARGHGTAAFLWDLIRKIL